MKRSVASLTLLIAFTGCAPRREEPANENMVAENVAMTPVAPVTETIRPGDPGALPDDRTPVSEGMIDPASAQVPVAERQDIDRWLLSNLQTLINDANTAYSAYDVMTFAMGYLCAFLAV